MTTQHPDHRDSLHLEEARVLDHQAHPGEQYILRLRAPLCAHHARPGQFVHLSCDAGLKMRRPLSIMRSDPAAGWIELLYKAVGAGTRGLSRRQVGEQLSCLGPIGRGFQLQGERRRALLLGGGVGIPPMIFLAAEMREANHDYRPLVLMGSEVPFPFRPRPSRILVPGMPEGSIAAMPLMEDWGIASRLASRQGYPGVYQGYITELARHWLDALPRSALEEVEIFACGPHPMLAACADLARAYDLPCQVSLEEYMACAVGGCAGCTVALHTAEGPAMKRVCVDGPVFPAEQVFPPG